VTGAYPTLEARKIIRRLGLSEQVKIARLLGREEAIPPEKVRALWLSEVLFQAGHVAPLLAPLKVAALRAYGRTAAKLLPQAVRDGARIYHYRAGFGGRSVDVARKLGMITLCDHSIVHPTFVASLPESRGRLETARLDPPTDPFERHILEDIDAADHLLLNSAFVKQTFLRLHYPKEKLNVVYQGIDDAFLRDLPARGQIRSGPLRLLAPAFSLRKGAPTIARALSELDDVDWSLTISRSIGPDMKSEFGDFLAHPLVTCIEPERTELGRVMTEHEVVIFPSYAEGSARIIFESLAAGAYVITSPNAGSVVEDGVHGRLISPWDENELRKVIRHAALIRDDLPKIGAASAAFVRERYSQSGYGREVLALYQRLLAPEPALA